MAEKPVSATTLLGIMAIALWLGAAIFFAAVVAPALFATLPTRTLAGEMVGRILPVLFLLGMLLGAVATVTEILPPRLPSWPARLAAAVLILLACGVAQFSVAPRISGLRRNSAVPIDSLPVDDVVREEFGRLHMMSVAWLGVAIVAAVALLIFAWLGARGSTEENKSALPQR